MKISWRIPDVLDLEYLLRQDRDLDSTELADRDRNLYLEAIVPRSGKAAGPRTVIRLWLEERRRMAASGDGANQALPGRLCQEVVSLLLLLAVLSGLVTGGGLAFSFLAYTGSRPVNVALYFGIFIVPQLLLLSFFVLSSLFRLALGRGLRSSVLYALLARLLAAAVLRLRRVALGRLPAEQRLRLQAVLGHGRARLHLHGGLFLWPVFILAQLFAVAFNCGVLGATLLKVAASDVAFGWQSTLQVSAETVAHLVRLLALPWSWAVPASIAYPSQAQIEGSRMILKEGIYHLATSDLVSWWPFLCLSVLCYGLLPRIFLLAAGWLGLRRALARLSFADAGCRRLLQRMQTPLVRTVGTRKEASSRDGAAGQACPAAQPAPERLREDVSRQEEKPSSRTEVPAGEELLVLVPDELYDACQRTHLDGLVLRRTGMGVGTVLPMEEEGGAEALCAGLGKDIGDVAGILVLQEAWQPPIREFLDLLSGLGRMLAGRGRLIVALVGKPTADTLFTPVRSLDLEIWEQSLSTLADARLEIVTMVES